MASILKSISNWFRGKKDDAAEAMADPIRDAKFAIEDSEGRVSDFESKVAQLMAQNKRLQRQREDAKADVEKWTNVAKRAAASGNEADVKKAVEEKVSANKKLVALDSETAANDKTIAGLREQLDRARTKISNAKSNQAVLAARLEGAKVRKELAQASSDFGSSSPLAALDDLDKATQSAETEAEAYEEITANANENLAEKYATSSVEVEDEVAKLMAEAGKTPAAK